MKKICCLFLIIFLFSITSCNTVINGHRCLVFETTYAENDNYIIFPEVVYNKNTKGFYPAKTLDDKYYNSYNSTKIELKEDCYIVYDITRISTFSYDGKMISEVETSYEENKYSLLSEGFYSSHQRPNPDNEELTEIEKEIWEYAKTKSLKNAFPYHIEGECKRKDNYVYFNVNVYDKVMWKGQALVNQGVKSSTLNKINESTKEIEEISSFSNCAIKSFNDNNVFLYNKKNDSLEYYNLDTKEGKVLSKSDDWYFFYITEKYVLRIDKDNTYKYTIISI